MTSSTMRSSEPGHRALLSFQALRGPSFRVETVRPLCAELHEQA